MSNITDWLMVVITAVYVIATILICRANIKAANASKAQLEEMKKQFAAENRPIIETEFLYKRRAFYVLRFINHGRRTAQHVKINLDQEFIDSLSEEPFRNIILKQKEKECVIGVGNHYDLFIGSNRMRGNSSLKPVTGEIHYEGSNESYTDKVFVDLRNYMTFFSTSTEKDDLLKAIKENTVELRGIKNVLKSMGDNNDKETAG